ncbi:hypothetical protein C2G38_2192226 [Gigaspora rosea]|uniref:Uncharacterized protein n=1 Tax=Gigaspora rosea TaxID=44941 RepID=A0A397UZD3_9GLOM|nr:hypothetical protein C2G38_2192226 [Gigaspora rosea]
MNKQSENNYLKSEEWINNTFERYHIRYISSSTFERLKIDGVISQDFISDLKQYQKVELHENILKFIAIIMQSINEVIFIHEYALNGTLNQDLHQNFSKIIVLKISGRMNAKAQYYVEYKYNYMKSAEGGNGLGQSSLGNCYRFGIGTYRDERKEIVMNNIILECYRYCMGTSIDENKPFEWFLKSAEGRNKSTEGGNSSGQNDVNLPRTETSDEGKALE